jgi:hypothetical protein
MVRLVVVKAARLSVGSLDDSEIAAARGVYELQE